MKCLIFAPLLLILVPLALGIFVFALLVGKLAKNASKDEWEGKVIDKLYNEKEEDDKKSSFYTLVIKTTKGEERKVAVLSGVWNAAKVGDKWIKVKGKLNPQKV